MQLTGGVIKLSESVIAKDVDVSNPIAARIGIRIKIMFGVQPAEALDPQSKALQVSRCDSVVAHHNPTWPHKDHDKH
jgi:hypothetical protein